MEEPKHILQENSGDESKVLPVFFKKIQFDVIKKKNIARNLTLAAPSERHQTEDLFLKSFYKPISFYI